LSASAWNAGRALCVLTTYDGDEDIYRALQAGARASSEGMTTMSSSPPSAPCMPQVAHSAAIAQRLAEPWVLKN